MGVGQGGRAGKKEQGGETSEGQGAREGRCEARRRRRGMRSPDSPVKTEPRRRGRQDGLSRRRTRVGHGHRRGWQNRRRAIADWHMSMQRVARKAPDQ